jgi:hypothetical protein
MHFSWIDRDDIAGPGFDNPASAGGFVSAAIHQANSKLLVGVTAESD